VAEFASGDIDIYPIDGFTQATFCQPEVEKTEAIIAQISDKGNYLICSIAYEHLPSVS
jgi:hypothetical protein